MLSAHDMQPVHGVLKIDGHVISITGPGPLPDPYVGDDLRTASVEIERFGQGADFRLSLTLSLAELEALSMAVRKALVHAAGRR